MTVQHSAITDPNIHEPKGVAAAGANTLYTANGSGSGVWKKVDSNMLKSLSGDGASNNKVVMTDGTNGFRLAIRDVYGAMTLTGNLAPFVVGATVDLQATGGYVPLTGAGAPWASENMFGGMTFLTDRLIVPINGVYRLQAWANISGFPSPTATVGARARVNGSIFSPRPVVTKSNSAGDSGQINGFGLFPLNANDYVQILVASDTAGNLVIKNANILIELVRAT